MIKVAKPGRDIYGPIGVYDSCGETINDDKGNFLLRRISFFSGLTLLVFITFFIVACGPKGCTGAVISSPRSLDQNFSDGGCWLKLQPGGPTALKFIQAAQITYGTSKGGTDSYFRIVKEGEEISDVTGATIRPISTLENKFNGDINAVKPYEIDYHDKNDSCLRDAETKNPLSTHCNQ